MSISKEKLMRIAERVLKRTKAYQYNRELSVPDEENYKMSYLLVKSNGKTPESILAYAVNDESVLLFHPMEEPVYEIILNDWQFAFDYDLFQYLEGGYDLILCGKQTTDGDTAQVSGALAKWMDLVHLNWVTEIHTDGSSDLKVTYLMEGRDIEARTKLPCLLSVEKDSFIPRMPSLILKISGRKKEIRFNKICFQARSA